VATMDSGWEMTRRGTSAIVREVGWGEVTTSKDMVMKTTKGSMTD
jgi:hypothetical protein